MNNQEILEYNKRCALFLGYNEEIVNDEVYFTLDDMLESLSEEELYFHKDWNWIMEVVNKIENLNRKDFLHYNEIEITRNHINVKYKMGTTKRYTFSDDYLKQAISDKTKHFKTKQEAVVEAINTFLIWYNEKNN